MKQLAEDAARILDALDVPYAHVVGHGLGATVAWHFAAAYPLRAMSLTAVSFGHPSAFGEAMATDQDQRQRSRYLELFLQSGVAEKQLLANDARTLLATAPGGGIEALANEAVLTAGLNWYRANLVPGGEGLDCPVIEVPTTLVWGTRDAIAGAAQARATGHYLRADYRLSEVPDGDHWLRFALPRPGLGDRAADAPELTALPRGRSGAVRVTCRCRRCSCRRTRSSRRCSSGWSSRGRKNHAESCM
ncbi:hypothetical protein MTP03_18560 [Tsukamurella sp. PLM1]|nr:hypothetical protein MTP03_18560 [Tsukamurella sp. PLM1]